MSKNKNKNKSKNKQNVEHALDHTPSQLLVRDAPDGAAVAAPKPHGADDAVQPLLDPEATSAFEAPEGPSVSVQIVSETGSPE